MGQDYYWVNDKYKLKCWLGRGINKDEYEDEETEITNILENANSYECEFGEKLFETLRETKLQDLKLKDMELVLSAAKMFEKLYLIPDIFLTVYVLNKAIGKGYIVGDYEESKFEDIEDYTDISAA